MIKYRHLLPLALLAFTLTYTGCFPLNPSTQTLHDELPQATSPNMTLGVFQSRINNGMSPGEVAAAVGSPNMVEKRRGNREVWIYDKVATESAASHQAAGVGGGGGLIANPDDLVLGGGAVAGASKGATVRRTTQRTLTVVITFIEGQVSDMQYHMSQF